jgi:hypothetical protein
MRKIGRPDEYASGKLTDQREVTLRLGNVDRRDILAAYGK